MSSVDSNNLHMTLDPERDLQRIHSLVIAHISRLETVVKMCENEYSRSASRVQITIDDVRSCYETLQQLQNVAFEIEQKHRTYQRTLARDTKYGSK